MDNCNNPEQEAKASYNHRKTPCRCPRCKEGWNAYMRSYRKANRDKMNKSAQDWHAKNPYSYAEKDARRRGQTDMSKIECELERDDIKLFYSLRDSYSRVTGVPYHVDHIEALANGGEHRMYNLDILTASDNCAKGARI